MNLKYNKTPLNLPTNPLAKSNTVYGAKFIGGGPNPSIFSKTIMKTNNSKKTLNQHAKTGVTNRHSQANKLGATPQPTSLN